MTGAATSHALVIVVLVTEVFKVAMVAWRLDDGPSVWAKFTSSGVRCHVTSIYPFTQLRKQSEDIHMPSVPVSPLRAGWGGSC